MSNLRGEKCVKNGVYLRASQQKLLDLLTRLDNKRGCFAKRSTIAEMIEYSIHTVNSDISTLKRLGYLTTNAIGVRRDAPSIIRLTERGKFFAKKLQTEYKESGTHDKEYHVQKSIKKQQSRRASVHGKSQQSPVVKKTPTNDPLSTYQQRVANKLKALDIDTNKAMEKARTTTLEQVDGAIILAKNYRGNIFNYPGFILSALEKSWSDSPLDEPKKQPGQRSSPRIEPVIWCERLFRADAMGWGSIKPGVKWEDIKETLTAEQTRYCETGERACIVPDLEVTKPLLESDLAVRAPSELGPSRKWLAQTVDNNADKDTSRRALAKIRAMFDINRKEKNQQRS